MTALYWELTIGILYHSIGIRPLDVLTSLQINYMVYEKRMYI